MLGKDNTSRTSRVISGIATGWIQFFFNLLLQIALIPTIVTVAQPETLGAYAILIQFLGYVALVDLGLAATTMRFLAQAHGYDDNGVRFSEVLSIARTSLLVTNIAFAIIVTLSSFWIQHFVTLSENLLADARYSILMVALWAIIRSPWVVYAGGMIAIQKMALVNVIYMIGTVARLLLSIGFILADMGLIGIMIANILSEVICAALFAGFFRRHYRGLQLRWKIQNRGLLKEILAFSFNVFIINIASLLIYSSGNLIVGFLHGAVAAGIYYATQVPATAGYSLFLMISRNASPAINELFARGEVLSLKRSFLQIHKLTMLLALPFSVCIVLLNRTFVSLWVGTGQYAGDLMTFALAGLIIILCISGVSNVFVQAKGNIKILSLITILEGIINLILALWLGRKIGLGGVVLGIFLAHLPNTLYLQWRAQTDLGIGWLSFLLKSATAPILLTLTTGSVMYALIAIIQPNNWPEFVVTAACFILVYSILCYQYGFNEIERRDVLDYFRRKFQPNRCVSFL